MDTIATHVPLLARLRALWSGAAIFFLLIAAAVASGCTTGRNPVSGGTRAYAYSWEEEQQIGAQSDEQIVAQYGIYDDEQVQQYVERIGEDVLVESHLRREDTPAEFRNVEFTFRVLDSPVVNAFALPGGYVYVTRGLMTHLNNEAQLAVVLGHEIAHVAARHASAQAAKAQLAQLGLLGAALGGEALGLPGGSILRAGQTGTQLLFLEYSRDNEEESDELGVEYAALAGYEAAEGAEFFRSLERIQESSGQALPTFLSTHPDPGNREQRIIEMAENWQQEVQMTEVDQEAYYSVLEGVVLGENPRHGFTEEGTFYHPELRFQFPVPQGFQVSNQARQVIMAEPEGQAQLVFTIAQEASSAQGAARQLAQEASQQQGVNILDEGSASSGNLPASYVLLGGQTQQGQDVRVLYYFLEYDGNVWVFQGASTAQAFSTYEDQFVRTMRNFAPLNNQRILDVQPTRLAIRAAQRTAPFQSFVDESALPPDMDAEQLAIINQVELGTQIESGRELKLPR